MDKKQEIAKDTTGNKHYSVPEGYFENLTGQILSNLPEEPMTVQTVKKGRIIRMRFMKYAAAAVVVGTGMFLAIHLHVFDAKKSDMLFVRTNQPSGSLYVTQSEDDAEYLEYLENSYSEALIQDQLVEIEGE